MAAKGVELASAYISLSVSTDDIPEQVEKAFGGAIKPAEKAGRQAGESFSKGAKSTAGKGLADSLARELGSAGDKGSRELLRSLASGHKQAERDVQVAGRRYAEALKRSMSGGSRDAAIKWEAEFKRALTARDSSKAYFDEFERVSSARGAKVGHAVGTVVGKSIGTAISLGVTAAAALATAAVGGLSYSLFKGFERYKSLDATNRRLRSMGKSGAQVKSIMDDINSVVEGTPISLDAAAESATQFLAGNIKEGEELREVLTSIADAAGFSGQSFEDLSLIFGQVMNNGKLQAEEMLQLNERNIPIQQWLQKELGVTGAELQKLSEDGKISFANLVDAVESNAPGMAKALGDTIDGALSNMKSAASRIGANIFAVIFGDPLSTDEGPGGMAKAINSVTDRLKEMNEWLVDNGDVIVEWIANTAKGITYLAESVTATVAGTTRGLAVFVNAFGDTYAATTRMTAAFQRLIGNTEKADELDHQADLAFGWADGLNATENEMYDLAKSIGGLRGDIDAWKNSTQDAARFAQDLGTAAGKIAPQNWWGKTIIKAPTADEIAKIKQAGYEVKAIPGTKDIEIVPATEEATKEMDAWREKQGMNPVEPPVEPDVVPGDQTMDEFVQRWFKHAITPPVQPELTAANTSMQSFVDEWSKAIITPHVAPGSGVPGSNPLGNFAPTGNANTGGALTPETQNVQTYLRNSLGFQGEIGGWRPPDGYNEHSSGKASDVMVGSAAEGNALLPNLLRQPGVEYILWQQKTWYPNGTSKPMEDRGSPTQNHMDHLHVKTFDQGGWLLPGQTLANNETGKPELILTPEQVKEMAAQGVDPNTLLHGGGSGAQPGPAGTPSARTEGYIPAAAGNIAPVGEGGLSNFLDLGESFVHNLIDTGAQAASMAATAAAGAASGGAGAAAGPAASTAIQMGAEAAKRGVSYLYDLGGIWGEALVEQAFPFGAPRWLGSANPMAFMPQGIPGQEKKEPGTMGAAKTAIASWAQPGNPAMASGTGQEGAQAALSAAKGQPSYQAAPPKGQAPQQGIDPTDPSTWFQNVGVFDQGGILQPNSMGINLSKKPEAIFTQKQLAEMQKTAGVADGQSGATYYVSARDEQSMVRELRRKERLDSMTHQGRRG